MRMQVDSATSAMAALYERLQDVGDKAMKCRRIGKEGSFKHQAISLCHKRNGVIAKGSRDQNRIPGFSVASAAL